MKVLNVYPTPITDALIAEQQNEWNEHCDPDVDTAIEQLEEFQHHAIAIERDCMTLALSLYGQDSDHWSPDTWAVMERWKPRCKALLDGSAK